MLKNKGFKLEKGELSYDEKFRLARSFTTSPEALDRLADDEYPDVRYWVARNTATSSETLARLANGGYSYARRAVAYNPNTLPKTLERLANDEDSYVRYRVARNPNTIQYIKDYLKIKEFLNYYGYYCSSKKPQHITRSFRSSGG